MHRRTTAAALALCLAACTPRTPIHYQPAPTPPEVRALWVVRDVLTNADSIKLTGKYEFSTFDKADLIYDKEKLQALGRDVKYERKRKPRPAPRPAAKPAEQPESGAEKMPASELKPLVDPEGKA